jgi:hypothetical protein
MVEELAQSSSAVRMARLRARRREAGLVRVEVPRAIVAEVKAAGGWEAWRSTVEGGAVRGDLERRAREWGLSPSSMAELLARPTNWQRRIIRWVVHLFRPLKSFEDT